MNTTDNFYITTVSGMTSALMAAEFPDGEPIIQDEEICIYLDPLAFMDHYRALPSDLWAGEFRRAHAVALELCERYGDEKELIEDCTGRKIAAQIIASLQILAKYDCPAVAGEITLPDECGSTAGKDSQPDKSGSTAGEDSQAKPRNTRQGKQLPKEFEGEDPDELAAVLDSLVNAGLLDEDWQPLKGVQNQFCAYMAHEIGELFDMQKWAKAFETFWKRSNLPQAYRQLNNNKRRYHESEKRKIKKALCNAVRNSPTLSESYNGKRLLDNAGQ